MSNGKFALEEITRILREVAEEVNTPHRQILLKQAEKLEQVTVPGKVGETLSKPFPKELIRYREGQKKKQLAYVETIHYIDRLNEAFGYQWSWEVLSETVTDTEVYCRGRLTVEIDGKTVVKEAYGGKDLTIVDVWDKATRQVTGKKPFSIADDLKSASSDALKKASSLLSIGGHLYKPAGSIAGGNGRSYSENRSAGYSATGAVA